MPIPKNRIEWRKIAPYESIEYIHNPHRERKVHRPNLKIVLTEHSIRLPSFEEPWRGCSSWRRFSCRRWGPSCSSSYASSELFQLIFKNIVKSGVRGLLRRHWEKFNPAGVRLYFSHLRIVTVAVLRKSWEIYCLVAELESSLCFGLLICFESV